MCVEEKERENSESSVYFGPLEREGWASDLKTKGEGTRKERDGVCQEKRKKEENIQFLTRGKKEKKRRKRRWSSYITCREGWGKKSRTHNPLEKRKGEETESGCNPFSGREIGSAFQGGKWGNRVGRKGKDSPPLKRREGNKKITPSSCNPSEGRKREEWNKKRGWIDLSHRGKKKKGGILSSEGKKKKISTKKKDLSIYAERQGGREGRARGKELFLRKRGTLFFSRREEGGGGRMTGERKR